MDVKIENISERKNHGSGQSRGMWRELGALLVSIYQRLREKTNEGMINQEIEKSYNELEEAIGGKSANRAITRTNDKVSWF